MNRAALTFLSTLALASVFAFLAPARAIQPGQLLEKHAQLRDDCTACHALGSGVESSRCRNCHALDSIGRDRPAIAQLHAPLAAVECFACHAEHAGRLGRAPAARFRHEMLATQQRADCRLCHAQQTPKDAVHANAGDSCSACHATAGWKPAHFEHGVLAPGASCAGCHGKRAPSDELHAQSQDCGACHSTRAWQPATYDHSRWFRFDRDHPARCGDCHEPGRGFKSYTCAACHPASQIAHEHDELGTRELSNCVECHRSGDKHEAEHGGGRRRGFEARKEHEDDEHEDR